MVCVLIYRVSTEEQGRKGFSLPEQAAACRERAITIARAARVDEPTLLEFSDELGGDILERPGLQAALEVCRSQQVAHVICLDPDRLARKLVLQLLVTEQIERSGAQLSFVQHDYQRTAEGQLFYSVRGAISEFEKAKILERTRRGKQGKLKAGGIATCVHPYGYTLLPRSPNQDTTLIVHADEARWVREIFRLTVEDQLGPLAIANRLRAQGVPTKRGGTWDGSTVTYILRNPIYKGQLPLNRFDARGVRSARRRPGRTEPVRLIVKPQAEWVYLPAPAIVDDGMWELAQRIAEGRKRQTQEGQGLLSGLLVCGLCGGAMHYKKRSGGYSVRCNGRQKTPLHPANAKCRAPQQPIVPFEQSVWATLETDRLNRESVTQYLAQRRTPNLSVQERLEREVAELEQAISERATEQERAFLLGTRGRVPAAMVERQLTEIASAIETLQQRRQHITAQLTALRRQDRAARDLLQRVEQMRTQIRTATSTDSLPARQFVLRMVFKAIIVYPGGEWDYELLG